ncbi:M23 family metallopeptidase [Streptomyces sp. NBC_01216]|uniref:M23 family metallopeptidase n=1 Tax=Streptomyces sp. NBC_01216 TaxID=2903778 RepID=UPI002E15F30F|nr:M23 family metallopeptidase [Streptomyces sp. NBC_01216]
MNDQHPHAGYVGDDGHSIGGFATDPLFGALPGGYDAGHSGQYDTTQWGSGAYDTYPADQPVTPQYAGYDTTGQYETTGHYDTTGQWDATAWNEAQQTGQYQSASFASYDTTGQWTTPGYESGAYDATAWNQAAPEHGRQAAEPVVPQQYTPDHEYVPATGEYAPGQEYAPEPAAYLPEQDAHHEHIGDTAYDAQADERFPEQHTDEPLAEHTARFEAAEQDAYPYDYATGTYDDAVEHDDRTQPGEPDDRMRVEAPVAARPVRRSSGGSRGRRRTPAKRSALLTVAVPSACVMGVAGIAAASVGGLADASPGTKDDTMALAAADPSSVKPVAANNELDTQLQALSADARDFGDRASRTQERIDLRLREEAEKKKREEEAARKEALRPKFLLPVKLHQLSARYGQAGVNWMSLHTGIDFPVQYGTPVMAATDGTVRTQWNSAYGNMAIVTAADGTETWYCHLSSTKIRSGKVKAGDVIAYSGNSGNSTGPHLHFEVRPNGGTPIDPLPWLRGHGLDPTT